MFKDSLLTGMEAHTAIPGTREADAGTSSRPSWVLSQTSQPVN